MKLVEWLVDTHLCPISVKQDPKTRQFLSVQTSAGRTLFDLAMTGRPKLEILHFLVKKNLSLDDVKNKKLPLKTLEGLLRAGIVVNPDGAAE